MNPYENPVSEPMFDLTWTFAIWFNRQPPNVQDTLMDYFGGSRGLYEALYHEAAAFIEANRDTEWGSDHSVSTDYFEQVDTWGYAAIERLVQLANQAGVYNLTY